MFSPNRNTKLKRARVRARQGKEDDERNIAAIGWQHKKNFCVNDVSVRHFNGVLRMRRMHITLFDFDSESPQDFFAFGKLSKMLFFSSKLWGFGVCLGCMSARASERATSMHMYPPYISLLLFFFLLLACTSREPPDTFSKIHTNKKIRRSYTRIYF